MKGVLRAATPPLVVLLVFLAAWEGLVLALDVAPYLLPAPSAIGQALFEHSGELAKGTALTGLASILGFASSLLLGALIAFAFSQSRLVQRSFYPYAIFLQTVPILAIAPLIVIWVGTGLLSVVLVAVIISLFPIITSGTTGLTRVDPGQLELFAIHNASRWQELVALRLPGSIPYFLAGAKVASGLAVIGAVVGEFFAGSDEYRGLGTIIIVTSGRLETAHLFAAVVASTLLGLALFGAVSLVGDAILKRWRGRETETE